MILENPKLSKLTTHRFLGGIGETIGSIIIDFHNMHDSSVEMSYFESVPWILKYCTEKLI